MPHSAQFEFFINILFNAMLSLGVPSPFYLFLKNIIQIPLTYAKPGIQILSTMQSYQIALAKLH